MALSFRQPIVTITKADRSCPPHDLAPSTSLWLTRIVRGHPWASASRTQYVVPSKLIHRTVGITPSGPAAKGLDRFLGLDR